MNANILSNETFAAIWIGISSICSLRLGVLNSAISFRRRTRTNDKDLNNPRLVDDIIVSYRSIEYQYIRIDDSTVNRFENKRIVIRSNLRGIIKANKSESQLLILIDFKSFYLCGYRSHRHCNNVCWN
jgi:hypothetical protein